MRTSVKLNRPETVGVLAVRGRSASKKVIDLLGNALGGIPFMLMVLVFFVLTVGDSVAGVAGELSFLFQVPLLLGVIASSGRST